MLKGELNKRYIDPKLLHRTLQREATYYCSRKALSLHTYRNATIYRGISTKGYGGVVDANGCFILNTSVFNGCSQQGADPNAKIDVSNDSVVYLGMFYGCWGHCLTDCLQHLWIFGHNGILPSLRDKKLVYTISDWRNGLPNNFFELLNELGINKDQLIEVVHPTQFKEVIIPDSCYYHNLELGHIEYTKEYVTMINRLRLVNDRPYRKVYFSRSCWKGSQSFGEERFENIFKKRGYEIVYPEKLSFNEQRRLLSETTELVSTEGSVMHNALFMPKGSTVVIIRKANYINQYQSVVNEISELDPIYIDANLSHLLFIPARPWIGPFFLYVNSRMAKYLGCKSTFPIITYMRYLHYYFKIKLGSLLGQIKLRV